MRNLKSTLIGLTAALVVSFLTCLGLLVMRQEPQTASAASTSDLVFTLMSDGTYSVTGNNIEVLKDNTAITGDLVIPETYNGIKVTQIGELAFYRCVNLTSVTIPNTVTKIGNNAFAYCESLTEINIPDSVVFIDNIAFNPCGLKSIMIPRSVTRLGNSIFGWDFEEVIYQGTQNEWNSIGRVGNPVNDPSIVVYAGEIPNTLMVNLEEYNVTSGSVAASLTGFRVKGYYSVSSTGYPTSANTEFSSGQAFSQEGFYRVEARFTFDLPEIYYFRIDKSAPVIDNYDKYTNTTFTLTAQDNFSDVSYWEYSLNGEGIQRCEDKTVTLGGGAEANGEWAVRVTDIVGNTSKWITINFAYRETFGNSEEIYNSFFCSTYYVVTLTQRNYASCYGSYTFAEYDFALNFAIQKEWDCRVILVEGGSSWNYVTPTNENARQIYTDINELNAVINKYAQKNISDRKVIGKNGSLLSNPTDANGITRPDALTAQLAELPSVLTSYSGYRFMLATASQALSTPKSIVEGNKSSAVIRYISDGISLRSGEELQLVYGVALKDVVSEQGWYLISESDTCGNVETYLIFVDLQAPEIEAVITNGNGEVEGIRFNQSYVDANTGTMRYVGFEIQNIMDNADDCLMIAVSGRSIDNVYVLGDELPVLNFENGFYGAYVITVYDRSHNVFEFTVYIAGEAPSLKYTSLTSEIACTFTIQINDSYNEITDVKFIKIHFDGTEEQIFADSFGTEVSAQNLVYKMSIGGKFVFEFTDLYGRTVRTSPLFYMKGLPSATLRGVKDGGKTKSDVSVIFNTDVTAELYVYRFGGWELTDAYELSQGVSSYTLGIVANSATTAIYKVLLYLTADRNLFTEYTFEIDGIPPNVEIYNENRVLILPDTVTTEYFYLSWQESGYTAYYRKQGAISEMKYIQGTVIKDEGNYIFTIYDDVRNELSFTVTLDNSVSYTLAGTYTVLEDGSLITRNSFVFTMTEPWSVFEVAASNGMSVYNGQKLDADGIYRYRLVDMYGNELLRTLIIDKTPPVPVIMTETGELLESGDVTASAFTVTCDEERVTLFYSLNGVFTAYDGAAINTIGSHTFKLTDFIGNFITFTVTIDREVKYQIDGTYIERDGAYWSRTWLQIITQEVTSVFFIEDEYGNVLDPTNRISMEGKYTVKIIDLAGNMAVLNLVIDKSAPTALIITASGKFLSNGEETNEPFKVICEELDSRITYSFGGSAVLAYNGEYLSERGKYSFNVINFLGNVAVITVAIDTTVNITVNGTYVIDDDGRYISKSWLAIACGEELQTFYILSTDGTMYDSAVRLISEGEYSVYAKDLSGNEIELILVIDNTPPTITLSGVASGGTCNGNVKVAISDYAQAYYRFDGGNSTGIIDFAEFLNEGEYLVTACDLVGNTVNVSFVIDLHVDVTPSLDLIEGQIISQKISFDFGESVSARLSVNGKENVYTGGNIVDAGYYILTVKDDFGNACEFHWIIVEPKAREYSIAVNGLGISAELDGAFLSVSIIDGMLILTQNGKYVLQFFDETMGSRWTLELEVDNVAPSVHLENTGKSIKISSPSKEGVTYFLYRNGEQIAFNFRTSAELTQTGSYQLVCIDDVGNFTVYEFELNYLNAISVALIAVVSSLTLIGIVAILVLRFKRKVF